MSHYVALQTLGIHIIHRDMRPNAGNPMNMDHQPAIKTSLLWLMKSLLTTNNTNNTNKTRDHFPEVT
jgi:hypothetical protein